MNKFYFLILIFTLGMVSCIKEIKIEYPEGVNLLTLNCLMTPGDTTRAQLSATIGYEQTKAIPYFGDARITLYENEKPVDTFQVCSQYFRPEAGDTVYTYCSSFPVKIGYTYKVVAYKPGYPEVFGTTTVPQKAKIAYLEYLPSEEDLAGHYYDVTIEDPSEKKDYFLLEMFHKDYDSEKTELRTQDPFVSLYSYYGIIKGPLDPERGYTAFFTDQHFINSKKTINFYATVPSGEKPNIVKLQSASREYYEYVKSLALNDAVSENPFIEPVRVKSNVKNGFGIVGAANVFVLEF